MTPSPMPILPLVRPLVPHVALVAAASASVTAVAVLLQAPLWVVGGAALVPWIPLLGAVVLRVRDLGNAWLALYVALALTQIGHVGEHVIQIVQLRLLGLSGEHAHGVFGALDVEWVHLGWNSWILLAVGILLVRMHRNPWLWITALLATWHLAEHVVLIAAYLATGAEGSPGLLASGGLLAGGLPLARPELHLVYNLLETTPLLIGLTWEWRRISPR